MRANVEHGPLPAHNYASLSKYLDDLGKRNEILLSCTNYLHDETFEQDEDENIATLCHAFRQYCQLCADQNALLEHDIFARSVAEAAARLPKSIGVLITDSEGPEFSPLSTEFSLPIYASVRMMLRPSPWVPAIVSMLPQQPSKLLYQLPHAFSEADHPLTNLRIFLITNTELAFSLSEVQAEDLVSATKDLKVLDLDCQLTAQAFQSRFASLLLNGTNLRSVTLHFKCWYWSSTPQSQECSAKPLLELLPWANLKEISLIGTSIHGHELSELLQKLSPGTCVTLDYVHLLTGLWVDLLDVLRTKADCNSSVIDPTGSEDENLGKVFETSWGVPVGTPLAFATAYIRGQISENPLRSSLTQDNGDTGQDHLLSW